MQNRIISRVKCVGTDANDTEYAMNSLPDKAKILSVTIVPNVSIATHATNYITVNIGAAGAVATRSTAATGGFLMTAGTAIVMTLVGTGTTLEMASAGLLLVEVVDTGTGPAYDFDVVILLEGIRQ